MKKYIDWVIEGVVLSATVVAFLFIIGKNIFGHISFKEETGTMICIIAFFAFFASLLLSYIKKRGRRCMIVVAAIYALENLIIYYAALDERMFNTSKIDLEALFLTFLVGFIAWPITMYEVDSVMRQK